MYRKTTHPQGSVGMNPPSANLFPSTQHHQQHVQQRQIFSDNTSGVSTNNKNINSLFSGMTNAEFPKASTSMGDNQTATSIRNSDMGNTANAETTANQPRRHQSINQLKNSQVDIARASSMPSLRTIGEEGFPVLDTFMGDGLINRANGGISALDDDSTAASSLGDFDFGSLQQHMPTPIHPIHESNSQPRRRNSQQKHQQFMRRSQSYTSVASTGDSISPMSLDQMLQKKKPTKQQRQRSRSSAGQMHPDKFFRQSALSHSALAASENAHHALQQSSSAARRRRLSDSCIARPMRMRSLPNSFFKEPSNKTNSFTQGPTVDPIWTRNIPTSPRAATQHQSIGVVSQPADVEQLFKLFDVVAENGGAGGKNKKMSSINKSQTPSNISASAAMDLGFPSLDEVIVPGMDSNPAVAESAHPQASINNETVMRSSSAGGDNSDRAGDVSIHRLSSFMDTEPALGDGADGFGGDLPPVRESDFWSLSAHRKDPFLGASDLIEQSLEANADAFLAEVEDNNYSSLLRVDRQLEGPELASTLSKIVASFG